MLTTKFTLYLEPVIEEVFACNNNLKWLEGNVMEAFCLIVRVNFLQFIIKNLSKLFK